MPVMNSLMKSQLKGYSSQKIGKIVRPILSFIGLSSIPLFDIINKELDVKYLSSDGMHVFF